jgi:hypothetical protein
MMTNLPMFPEHDSGDDNTPLPLLVAKKWDFQLAFHIVEGKYLYAIQDWVRGLSGEEDIRKVWGYFKKQKAWPQMCNSVHLMPYTASDGKTYQRNFTSAENLTFITHYLRELESRPLLQEIKIFLNQHLSLQHKEKAIHDLAEPLSEESSNIELDEEMCCLNLISNDKTSPYNHPHLLDSFVGRTQDKIIVEYYGVITNDIYTGLWKRTPGNLKLQLGAVQLNKTQMPFLARSFHDMVCEMVKLQLSHREDLWWWEIRECVKQTTTLVRNMINQAEVFLKIDIATGRPLLQHG